MLPAMCFMITAMLFASGSSVDEEVRGLDLREGLVRMPFQLAELTDRIVEVLLFEHRVSLQRQQAV